MIAYREQVEISKNCTDAAFGYATAAMHASFEATNRMFAAWGQMASAVAPQPEPDLHEWSGAPRRPRTALLDTAPTAAAPAYPDPFQAFAAFWGLPNPALPVAQTPSLPAMMMWWNWLPQSSVPAAWPWAYGMMHAGVPRSVAWPMAEANAAMTEAMTRTQQAAQAQFPAYRSDAGFASTQVWQATATRAMMGVPAGFAAFWPWFGDRAG